MFHMPEGDKNELDIICHDNFYSFDRRGASVGSGVFQRSKRSET
jgi:hypothetical protein